MEEKKNVVWYEKILIPAFVALIGLVGNYIVFKQEIAKSDKTTKLETQKIAKEIEATYSTLNVNVVTLFKEDLTSNNPQSRQRALLILSSLDEKMTHKANILTAFSLHDENAQVRELSSLLVEELDKNIKDQKKTIEITKNKPNAKNKTLKEDIIKAESIIANGRKELNRCLAVIGSLNSETAAWSLAANIRLQYKGSNRFSVYYSPNKYHALVVGDPFNNPQDAEKALSEIKPYLPQNYDKTAVRCGVNWGDPKWVD